MRAQITAILAVVALFAMTVTCMPSGRDPWDPMGFYCEATSDCAIGFVCARNICPDCNACVPVCAPSSTNCKNAPEPDAYFCVEPFELDIDWLDEPGHVCFPKNGVELACCKSACDCDVSGACDPECEHCDPECDGCACNETSDCDPGCEHCDPECVY